MEEGKGLVEDGPVTLGRVLHTAHLYRGILDDFSDSVPLDHLHCPLSLKIASHNEKGARAYLEHNYSEEEANRFYNIACTFIGRINTRPEHSF